MNISLTPELENLVKEKVKSGKYLSASEVVREALRLLDQRDEEYELWKKEVREKVEEGYAQLKRGEGIPASRARVELAKLKARRKASI